MSDYLKPMMLAMLAIAVSLGVLARCSYVEFTKEQAYQKLHRCQFVSKVETENRRYCGKACTRPEVKETYQCDNGPLVYLR